MQWLLQLKTYCTKQLDLETAGVIFIVSMICAGCILSYDKPPPPPRIPPVHLVTIIIDGTSITVPIFGTNVEFKVR